MVAILAGLTCAMGPMWMLKLYFVPYVVSAWCSNSLKSWVAHRRILFGGAIQPWYYLPNVVFFGRRSSLCGWTSSPTCTTMAMRRSFLGTVGR